MAVVNLWAYGAFGEGVNLFCGSLMFGYAILVIARRYADLDRRPRTDREQSQERERVADWYRRLSPKDKEQVARAIDAMRVVGSTGITAKEAARQMARFR